MRMYWSNNRLCLEPEGKEECHALAVVGEAIRFNLKLDDGSPPCPYTKEEGAGPYPREGAKGS
jgi:hypothetical protein